jgi:hypothetical protein
VSLDTWEQDLAAYRAVLADIESGKLRLQQGQEEFLADLQRRIALLEEKIQGQDSAADEPWTDEQGLAT